MSAIIRYCSAICTCDAEGAPDCAAVCSTWVATVCMLAIIASSRARTSGCSSMAMNGSRPPNIATRVTA
ncbi:hypothetical protein J2Z79_002920 [Symbiobacterium terraclitae]|uniref:Uncharacterized protein n=1 Tax=Symbiobacterium terraclitae TaxID=557451 RepID=A0ABS4JVC5_9FIRM|nr:hypothetical protein [Symbiobacterium terraclitae]MBP2019481.1 hypothetical protein [Symbiobacterium terraclitae]